jgi:hypothetical protein
MEIMLEIFGAIGLGALLVGFFINQRCTPRAKILYNLLNLVGALILTIYAIENHSMLFIALEGVWAMLSIVFIYDFYRPKVVFGKKGKKKR